MEKKIPHVPDLQVYVHKCRHNPIVDAIKCEKCRPIVEAAEKKARITGSVATMLMGTSALASVESLTADEVLHFNEAIEHYNKRRDGDRGLRTIADVWSLLVFALHEKARRSLVEAALNNETDQAAKINDIARELGTEWRGSGHIREMKDGTWQLRFKRHGEEEGCVHDCKTAVEALERFKKHSAPTEEEKKAVVDLTWDVRSESGAALVEAIMAVEGTRVK